MTWWVDGYLDFSLRKLDLCPGADVSFSVKGESKSEDVDVSVFWHSPSVNVGWYPICQISRGDSTIFYGEGTENDEHWHDLLVRAADALAQELQATSMIS